MGAYYNEIDPYAAEWLRRLIDAGHIAPGVVDQRDIRDVRPADLDGFTQCHFFAGVGIWSYALRLAGVSDNQPLWTASCPCQPFSAAGAGAGIDDERHLWPVIQWLAEQCRPEAILGEQVASKDGLNWFDIVSADMEAADYAIGAVNTCACGFGAPHIRQRLYFAAHDNRRFGHNGGPEWLADAPGIGSHGRGDSQPGNEPGSQQRSERLCDVDRLGNADGAGSLPSAHTGVHRGEESRGSRDGEPERPSPAIGVGNAQREGPQGHAGDGDHRDQPGRDNAGQERSAAAAGASERLADSHGQHGRPEREQRSGEQRQQPQDGRIGDRHTGPGPVNGPWADADWLHCRDGKWRPVRSGSFPLVTGAASRMGRLRAYGNGLCAEQAAGFIRAYMERDMVDLKQAPAGDLFEWGI